MSEIIKQAVRTAAGSRLNQFVLASPTRLAMPIAVYPGLAITGATVRALVTNAKAQFEAVSALHERYRTPIVLSAMDLSAEAEAFGCAIQLTENEIPVVTGRRVSDRAQADKLPVPQPGDRRTKIHLETVRQLGKLAGAKFVLGGCIGPFSLAARLVGVSEAMELTLTEPELIHVLLEKATCFLAAYARAFHEAGADGVLMAEPAAGLLSPRGLAGFSSAYVRRISQAVESERFSIVLHNCGAKLVHLPAMLESGLKFFHFGAPMDLMAALEKAPADAVLSGNLDPANVFVQMPPNELAGCVRNLLERTQAHRNFVLSSGCDLPPGTPLKNLDSFHAATGSLPGQ